MASHDARETRRNKSTEGKQVDAVHLPLGTIDKGERVVRVAGGIAVAGIVLGDGHDATTFESAGISDAPPCDRFGIIAKGAGANNGVAGIRIHVDRRRKVDVYAHFATLTGHLSTIVLDQSGVLYGTEHHVFREARGAT